MKYVILSVVDIKAGVFAQPFYAPSQGHAIRSFLDAVREDRPDNLMRKHPADFDLYVLGEFNDQVVKPAVNGFILLERPHVVANGVEAFPPDEGLALA